MPPETAAAAFGNAARATRTVSARTSLGPLGCNDIRTHPHTTTSAFKTTTKSQRPTSHQAPD